MYQFWNPSPVGAKVGDCAVRAIAKALNVDWETAYTMLCLKGYAMYDMPNSNSVINALLNDKGYVRGAVPNTCPNCYTVEDFANDNPVGTYILGVGEHVVCVKDGTVYDSWDSTKEIPIFYWRKERE